MRINSHVNTVTSPDRSGSISIRNLELSGHRVVYGNHHGIHESHVDHSINGIYLKSEPNSSSQDALPPIPPSMRRSTTTRDRELLPEMPAIHGLSGLRVDDSATWHVGSIPLQNLNQSGLPLPPPPTAGERIHHKKGVVPRNIPTTSSSMERIAVTIHRSTDEVSFSALEYYGCREDTLDDLLLTTFQLMSRIPGQAAADIVMDMPEWMRASFLDRFKLPPLVDSILSSRLEGYDHAEEKNVDDDVAVHADVVWTNALAVGSFSDGADQVFTTRVAGHSRLNRLTLKTIKKPISRFIPSAPDYSPLTLPTIDPVNTETVVRIAPDIGPSASERLLGAQLKTRKLFRELEEDAVISTSESRVILPDDTLNDWQYVAPPKFIEHRSTAVRQESKKIERLVVYMEPGLPPVTDDMVESFTVARLTAEKPNHCSNVYAGLPSIPESSVVENLSSDDFIGPVMADAELAITPAAVNSSENAIKVVAGNDNAPLPAVQTTETSSVDLPQEVGGDASPAATAAEIRIADAGIIMPPHETSGPTQGSDSDAQPVHIVEHPVHTGITELKNDLSELRHTLNVLKNNMYIGLKAVRKADRPAAPVIEHDIASTIATQIASTFADKIANSISSSISSTVAAAASSKRTSNLGEIFPNEDENGGGQSTRSASTSGHAERKGQTVAPIILRPKKTAKAPRAIQGTSFDLKKYDGLV